MIIILFGAPGVGKGTQAQILADELGVAHISTGDAFRAAIQGQTEVGLIAKRYVDAGDLVPDDVTARIVEEAMIKPDCQNGVILDGFPRTRAQADALATMLSRIGQEISCVVNIEVPNEHIVQRLLSRGRADDTVEVINNRLAVYQQETAPLLEYYSKLGLLKHLDGVGSVEEVSQRILAIVSQPS